MAPARRIRQFASDNSIVRVIVSLGCASALLYVALIVVARFTTEFDLGSGPRDLFRAGHGALLSIITVYWGAGTHFLLVRFGYGGLRHYTLSFALLATMSTLTVLIPMSVLLLVGMGHDATFTVELRHLLRYFGEPVLQKLLYGVFVVSAGPLIWWMYYRVFARIP